MLSADVSKHATSEQECVLKSKHILLQYNTVNTRHLQCTPYNKNGSAEQS